MREKKFYRESASGVDAVFERMWVAVGRPSLGYARAFDVSENDIKNWRRRGRVSRQYLEGFALEHGVSLDWLLHGDQPADAQAEVHQVKQNVQTYGLSADEAALLEAYREVDPEARVTLQNLLKVIANAAPAAIEAPKSKTRQPRHAGEVEPVLRRSAAAPVKKPGRQRGPSDGTK